MTDELDGKIAALERIHQPTLDFGGFWWAPRELLEGWTYQLQDRGADTVEANEQLGFGADMRDYSMCMDMLNHIGVSRVINQVV